MSVCFLDNFMFLIIFWIFRLFLYCFSFLIKFKFLCYVLLFNKLLSILVNLWLICNNYLWWVMLLVLLLNLDGYNL